MKQLDTPKSEVIFSQNDIRKIEKSKTNPPTQIQATEVMQAMQKAQVTQAAQKAQVTQAAQKAQVTQATQIKTEEEKP